MTPDDAPADPVPSAGAAEPAPPATNPVEPLATNPVEPLATKPVPPSATKPIANNFRHKFAQQRLSGTTVIFTAKWAMSLFFAFCAIFLALGIVLFNSAADIVSYDKRYGINTPVKPPERKKLVERLLKKEQFEIEINEDMTGDVFIQYKIEGFYQNHRQYAKSFTQEQLNGNNPFSISTCDDFDKDAGLRVYYPCGLIARSIFNDDYLIFKKNPGEKEFKPVKVSHHVNHMIDSNLQVLDSYKNIKPTDQKAQPTEKQNPLNFWIYGLFPPERCQPLVTNSTKVKVDDVKMLYVAWEDAARTKPACDWEKKPIKCKFSFETNKIADPRENAEDKNTAKTCKDHILAFENEERGNTAWKYRVYKHSYTYEYRELYGVEDPQFIVWMFVAGYPTFYKQWGKIIKDDDDDKDVTFKKGTVLKVYAFDNFEVNSFKGYKFFSVTTDNWLGTRSKGLAIAYLVTSIICFLSAGYLLLLWLGRRQDLVGVSEFDDTPTTVLPTSKLY